jgi:hypothetical protein
MLITTSFVDVGCQGRISDSSVFTNTELVPLNGREKSVPYFFIGDEAFPFSKNLMKFIPDNIQGAQKNEFSITASAEPTELQKIYLASCHQFSKCFINLCF